GELPANIESAIVRLISAQMHIPIEHIDVEMELSELGFDSIAYVSLANALNQAHQLELAPTIFFEHRTVRNLAQHLAREQAGSFAESATTQPSGGAAREQDTSMTSPQLRKARSRRAPVARVPEDDAIAIIGMSGCFPQARDL